MKWRNFKNIGIVFLLSLFGITEVLADGIYAGIGFYNLTAKVGSRKTSLSNFSNYSLIYTKSFLSRTSFEVGYSFLFENLLGGDMSYGPHIGLRYYHFGTSTNQISSLESLSVQIKKSYNPYVSAGFMQREFQSVKSSYSGFYLGGGLEMGWQRNFSFFTDLKYAKLNGPVKGEATEITATIGLIYHDI